MFTLARNVLHIDIDKCKTFMLNMQIMFRAEVKSMVKLMGKREDLEESGSGARLTGVKVYFGSFLKKISEAISYSVCPSVFPYVE